MPRAFPQEFENTKQVGVSPIEDVAESSIFVPSQRINWPKPRSVLTQLQQVKAAGLTNKPSVAVPEAPVTVSPNTQGQPMNLTNVGVQRTPNGDGYDLNISFNRNAGDQYFTTAKIFMRQGGDNPVAIGEGPVSPIKITVPRTHKPVTIFAQASGNWGEVPLSNCPVKALSLR